MRGRKEQGTKQPESNNMALVSPYLSMISLNVNILTYPTKTHKWLEDKLYTGYRATSSALKTQTENGGMEKRCSI